jgi:hypothetical protein
VINWHTNFDHFRGGHCRTYLPPPVYTDITNPTTWTTTYRNAVAAAATGFIASVNAYSGAPFTTLTLCMLRRVVDKQPLTVPVLRPVVGATSRSIIGNQRRRLT